MSDIRHIKPAGSVPKRISKVMNGTLVERKKICRCINGKLVVVWNVGEEEKSYITFTISGGETYFHMQPLELTGNGHIGKLIVNQGTMVKEYEYNTEKEYWFTNLSTTAKNVTIEVENIEELADSETSKLRAFCLNCQRTLRIDLSAAKNLKRIGQYALGNNSTMVGSVLNTITLPDSVIELAENAFRLSDELVNLRLSKNIKKIGSSCFMMCSKLPEITLYNKIESMGTKVFYGCKSLKNIYYDGTESEWNAIDKPADWLGDNCPAQIVFMK